jgi:hypothetical protein
MEIIIPKLPKYLVVLLYGARLLDVGAVELRFLLVFLFIYLFKIYHSGCCSVVWLMMVSFG